jgi:hypothetical protein
MDEQLPDREFCCGQLKIDGFPVWELSELLTAPHHKKLPCYETFYQASDLDSSFGRTQTKDKELTCMWKSRRQCRLGSLATAVRELARYKLDLVGVQEVRWDKGGTAREGDYTLSVEKEIEVINWEQKCCTPKDTTSR